MSAVTTLTNQQIATSYVQLLHTGDSDGLGSTPLVIYDGDGTATDLEVAGNHINVKTKLKLAGVALDATASEQKAFSGLTATSSELNQLDDVEVGGSNADDIISVGATQTLTNKTIDGGTF